NRSNAAEQTARLATVCRPGVVVHRVVPGLAIRTPSPMNAPLPNWLERMLGIEPAGAGEGTAWNLESSWSWAPWVTLLFVIGSIFYVTWIYLHEGGEAGRRYRIFLAGIRLTLIGLVLFMIAQFVLSLERTGLPYVVFVVDDSASMGISDRYDD